MSTLCGHLAIIWAAGIGPQYLKALYQEYTDSSFQVTLFMQLLPTVVPTCPASTFLLLSTVLCHALTGYALAKV